MSSSGASRGGGSNFTQGTIAARPAATPNALYFATDTGEWWIANAAGNAWQSIASSSAANFVTSTIMFSGSGNFAYLAARDSGNGDIQLNNHTEAIGHLASRLAGSGLLVKEGANCKQGLTAAMVAGTITVANTSVTANSRILLTRAPGGTNPGAVNVSAIVAGTSFTITSTNAADTGTVFFQIFEPG